MEMCKLSTFLFIILAFVLTALGHIQLVNHKDSCLEVHNILRSLHKNTGKLVWDNSLATSAEKWAIKMAHAGKISPNTHNANQHGENVDFYRGKTPPSCEEIVLGWYRGGRLINYDPALIRHWDVEVHKFTQIVWRATTRLGVGIAFDDIKRQTFVVARYSPPGNYLGLYKYNVQPLISGNRPPTLEELRGGMSLIVTKRPTTTPVKTTAAPVACKDTTPNCFGLLSYCYHTTVRMHCRKSCNLC